MRKNNQVVYPFIDCLQWVQEQSKSNDWEWCVGEYKYEE